MVPKVIHQIVLGSEINHIIHECLESWKALEGLGFEIRRWTDQDIEALIFSEYQFARDSFTNARNLAEAADIARYLIVYHHGGCYVDWDVQLLDTGKFIKLIEDNQNGFLLLDPNDQGIAAECFAAVKNESFLYLVVKDIVHLFENKSRQQLHTLVYSGPFRLKEVLESNNTSTTQTILYIKDVFAYDYSEIKTMPDRKINQPMIHYWLHSWIASEIEP